MWGRALLAVFVVALTSGCRSELSVGGNEHEFTAGCHGDSAWACPPDQPQSRTPGSIVVAQPTGNLVPPKLTLTLEISEGEPVKFDIIPLPSTPCPMSFGGVGDGPTAVQGVPPDGGPGPPGAVPWCRHPWCATQDFTLTAMATPIPPGSPRSCTVLLQPRIANTPLPSWPWTVDVAVAAAVGPQPAADAGVNGRLQEAISTSFQPADWQEGFFTSSSQNENRLEKLGAKNVLIQLLNGGAIPLLQYSTDPGQQQWDFTALDAIVQPVLQAGGQAMLQIKAPPPFLTNAMGSLDVNAFAAYCANLVHYYNDPNGFPWGAGNIAKSPSGIPIRWWSILSDFNEGVDVLGIPSAAYYGSIYHQAAQSMLSASATPIQLVGFEFSYSDTHNGGDPTVQVQPFLDALDGGQFDGDIPTPISALAFHFFGTTHHMQPDLDIFGAANDFATKLTQLPSTGIPVWVTENNVQADVPTKTDMSMNDPSNQFVNDPRGTDAFFTAWRPYVFSKLGKVGVQALYHWGFTAGQCPTLPDGGVPDPCAVAPADGGPVDLDTQNAEVDFVSGTPFVSYWVDYYLGQWFPPSPGQKILTLDVSDSSIEALATQDDQGSVRVMVVDIQTEPPDGGVIVDGHGDPLTVVVDIPAALGTFSTLTEVHIDATTDRVAGPSVTTATPVTTSGSTKRVVNLPGYGVAFLRFSP